MKGVGAHATEKKQTARKVRKQRIKDARLEKIPHILQQMDG
jgi:hypothetical protein